MITNNKKIGYDCDGVICYQHQDGWFGNLMWKFVPKKWSLITHYKAKRTSLKLVPNSYIITGRPSGEWILTTNQLHDWKIDAILCINPDRDSPDKMKSAMWKIKRINELGITEFYEDDDDTVELLKVATKAKIIKVKNGKIQF